MPDATTAQRNATVNRTGEQSPKHALLYTPAEERFERVTRLAQQTLAVPISGVMLTDDGKQWFKSIAGWDVTELPENRALCSWAVEADGPTIIEDLEKDARTAQHPLVKHAPLLRFYAAYPLLDAHGWRVGAFCLFDVKPRSLSTAQRQSLLDLAEIAQRELVADRPLSPDCSIATRLVIARREGMIDPLTRLWNRRGAYVLVRAAFDRADKADHAIALATLDIDDFRQINGRYGHQTGDEVLRSIARRLVNAVRGDDLAFRLVDDQFLLLMTNLAEPAATRVLERVRWTIADGALSTQSGELAIALSAGLVVRPPQDSASIDNLIARANTALRDTIATRRSHLPLSS